MATTWGPKASFRLVSARKKSARSRSSMLTKIRRARSSSAARCHSRVVCTSTPIRALITNTADSHTRSAPSASATKLESPGVSSRLTFRSCQEKLDSVAEIDIPRAFSSASASETVVPSATLPRRLIAPAWNSSASCREVLPLPRWPTSATLRMRSAGLCMPVSSLGCRSVRDAIATELWRTRLVPSHARWCAVIMPPAQHDEWRFTPGRGECGAKVRVATVAGRQFGRVTWRADRDARGTSEHDPALGRRRLPGQRPPPRLRRRPHRTLDRSRARRRAALRRPGRDAQPRQRSGGGASWITPSTRSSLRPPAESARCPPSRSTPAANLGASSSAACRSLRLPGAARLRHHRPP